MYDTSSTVAACIFYCWQVLANGTVHVLTEVRVLPAALRMTEVEKKILDVFEKEMKASRRGLAASSATDPSRWKEIQFRSNETRIHLYEHTCSRHFCKVGFEDRERPFCSCGTDEQSCGMPERPSIVDEMLLPSFLKNQYQKRPQLNRASDRLKGRRVGGLSLEKIFNDFVKQEKLHSIRVVKEGKDTEKLPPGSTHQTLLEWLKNGYSVCAADGVPHQTSLALGCDRGVGGVECLLWNAKVR